MPSAILTSFSFFNSRTCARSQDTWFPAHRNCSCCKGYVNACTAPMCLDLGVCGCTLEDSDIHAAAE